MKCKWCDKEFIQKGKEHFCSKSCAAKFNTEKSRIKSNEKHINFVNEYNMHPQHCQYCGKVLTFKRRFRKFCNSSCAAKFNNKLRNKKLAIKCLNCGKEISKQNTKFCCNKCQQEYQFKQHVFIVDKMGKFNAIQYKTGIKEVNRVFVRKYLEYKHGHKCSICGNTHWLGKPILLIVDHIDGNIENYNVNNYRLVCSNCDATLPTYKNKNKGKGKRIYRRLK